MSVVTFLLPAPARFGAQRWLPDVARAFGRADVATQTPGRRAQLARHVDLPDGSWPLAALSRQVDAGDAGAPETAWLRADPVWLRPDINGVRLMAHGDALGVSTDDCAALLPALQEMFADAGFQLDAPVPARWYLRLPRDTRLPAFPDPSDALGTDLSEFEDTSPDARRWRALGSEAQILLHNHPWNAARAAAGRPPINALWFWGGGTLPEARAGGGAAPRQVYTDDATLHALAAGAAGAQALPSRWPDLDLDLDPGAAALFDLSALRDLRQLQADWLQPALAAMKRGRIAVLTLDDEDGSVFALRRWHRLRMWRAPRTPAAKPS
ncbi:phosphoglycerate mutase [Luteimonas sp. 100069]|uniref:phosphoglycerate mutase n=1 Tax=Luteimonas sp. 100069 TaxID=2006109 RepID=UPI000F4D6390|nr:phosphoglycerate mutase [Luteimonas sp. 100069]RPD88734.1 phosphoglycerate mutase [Luteimonas sp. 100069]